MFEMKVNWATAAPSGHQAKLDMNPNKLSKLNKKQIN
jgi:hypothetical protein